MSVEKAEKHKVYSLVIGRFQVVPPHAGHCALINSLLDEGKNVCVALRQEDKSEKNPYSFWERLVGFVDLYSEEMKEGRLIVIPLPDIDEVVYGRNVGWRIREIRLSPELEAISGTELRKKNFQ